MEKIEKELVEEYIDFLYEEFKNDEMYYPEVIQSRLDFSAGFSAKENVIKETLKTLEGLISNINSSTPLEQMLKSRDLDRLNNKIEALQSLL